MDPVEPPGARTWIHPGWRGALAGLELDRPARWTVAAPGQPASLSSTTCSFRVTLADGRAVYFKRYVYAPGRRGRYLLRASRAAREVASYERMRALGIPTLEVLAHGELRRLGALHAAFVVTREVEGSVPLDTRVERLRSERGADELRQALEPVLGRVLEQARQAHDAGFFHGDLSWRNVLVVDGAGGPETVWIDCPRGGRRRRIERARVSELERFLRPLLGEPSEIDIADLLARHYGAADPARLLRRIHARHARWLRRGPHEHAERLPAHRLEALARSR